MDKQLAAAIRDSGEESLTLLTNKGVYKRAAKDAENAQADITETETSAEVSVGGEKCIITLPLENSKCTCPSRTVCRHIITAILLLKDNIPDEATQREESTPEIPSQESEETPEDTREKPSEAELVKIRSCANMCMELICGVLRHGLVRIPETAAEDIELAAVRCHAAKMAECERLMRNLSGRIADFAARRASFDSRVFTQKLMETARHLEHIMSDDITCDDLGSFRSVYKNIDGKLEILPVSERTVFGGDYTGKIYYFVNCEPDTECRFLTFSDIRPVFYDTARKRMPEVSPWGMNTTLRSMMKRRMTLVGAKVCDGKLSSSKETAVAAHMPAVLDCSLIHRLMITDFREIVITLAECHSDRENDRLFFIYPERMVRYGFDKNEQQLIITLKDHRGCTADCIVKYCTETKSFIEQLENICKRMETHSGKTYTMLASAYIENGTLRFFPIEIYDSIKPLFTHTFELPHEYELLAENGIYAAETNRHIACVSDILTNIVRSGLQSEHDCKNLISESLSMGMEGLAGLIADVADSSECCRHSMNDGSRRVLNTMLKLNSYILAANERTDSISALSRLQDTLYISEV